MENCIYYGCGNVDEFGNLVEKTRQTDPYSYDGYVTYRNGENSEANTTIYSDRLSGEDYDKNRALKLKHFGNQGDDFSNRSVENIEAFLSEFLNKTVKIIFIMEYCNKSDGNPYWRFDVKTNK